MRDIPEEMAARIESGAATLCHAWRVTRADGVQMGFTDHDRALEVDGTRCSPVEGFEAGVREGEAGLEPGSLTFNALVYFILTNIFLGLFNLLPIPPFDGSHIVGGLLPRKWAVNWQKLQSLGMLFFIVLIAATWAFPNSGLIENTVLPPVLWLQDRYFELAEWIARGIAE